MGRIMNFMREWRAFREQRQVDDSTNAEMLALLAGTRPITRSEALEIPAVAGCIELIGNVIAELPIKLYETDGSATSEITDDPRLILLNDDTGDILSGQQWKKAAVRDYFLAGNAYVYINKLGNTVRSLHYTDCTAVTANVGADPIFKQADLLVNGKIYRDYEFLKITRNTVNGVTGSGLLQENSVMLSLAYAGLRYERTLLKTGGNKRGFLSSENKLDEPALTALRAGFERMYSDDSSAVVVLNKGLSFIPASSTAVELQLQEGKTTNATEICSIFNMSSRVLNGGATDPEYAAAAQYGVVPVINAIVAALNKDLLLEAEKPTRYFEIDTKQLLRGDMLRRFQAYQIAVGSNIMQPDECRYEEDLPPLGLDFIKLGLNDVLYKPRTGEVYTPNTDRWTTLSQGGTGGNGDSANIVPNGGKTDEN